VYATVTVLPYGDNDPCLSSNCQEVCEAESATTFNCSCFTGHRLVDDYKCIGSSAEILCILREVVTDE
jgi:hypothetical protein